jgi:excisionase family DNA binding protein
MSSPREASLTAAEQFAALFDLPARLDRIERLLERLVGGQEAMAHAGALAPVDLAAAAPVLGKSVATLRRMAKAGQLPGAFRMGRSWRIRLGDVRAQDDEIGQLAQQARAR